MALSYSAILRVPQSYTILGLDSLEIWEFTFGVSSGIATIVDLLTLEKSLYEGYFGGTFSWVISADATYDIYTISWTGLTADPATDVNILTAAFFGNPVALYISGFSGGEIVSTQFVYGELCEATGNCEVCPPSVNPEDATDCPSCYDQSIAFCDSVIEILGLDADTEYDFKVTDQATGKVYNYTATTDGFGEADLLTADFPTGLFTPYNGAFTISIFDVDGDPVILTYGYVNYSCIELTVTNTTTIA